MAKAFSNDLTFRQFQVSDCTFKVRLKTSLYPVEFLNTTVEVFGEVRLYDVTLGPDSPLESSHSLIKKLHDFDEDIKGCQELPSSTDKSHNLSARSQLQKIINDFKTRYKAVVEVDTIRHVSEARDVLAKNLQFRIIQARKKALQTQMKS